MNSSCDNLFLKSVQFSINVVSEYSGIIMLLEKILAS
jgi:hypothetical protein